MGWDTDLIVFYEEVEGNWYRSDMVFWCSCISGRIELNHANIGAMRPPKHWIVV